jgi:hypothetical protein
MFSLAGVFLCCVCACREELASGGSTAGNRRDAKVTERINDRPGRREEDDQRSVRTSMRVINETNIRE